MQNGQNGVGKRMAFVILALALFNFLLLNILRPGGLMAYVLPTACWAFLAAVVLKIYGFGKIRSWFEGRVALVAALVAICYIVVIMDIGLLVGFGNSPYSFTPLMMTTNIIMIVSTLLGMELSRAAIVKSFGGKRPFLAIGLVSILYTLIGISTAKLFSLGGPLEFTKFMGVGLLPLLAENILATYLALIGGPVASLAYRAPMMAFWWFCPILPNLSWGIEALVGVMTPAIAFFVINQFVPSFTLRKAGLPVERRGFGRPKRSSVKLWMAVSVLCVAMVWTSTGLLGVWTTTVLSGSMMPAMDVGDMAVVYKADASSIKSGDMIQFWRNGEMVVHRVTEVYDEGGTTLFVTKGDANSSVDMDPVQPAQIAGKVAFTIPKIGWAVIGVKSFAVGVWSFVTANAGLVVLTISAGMGLFGLIRLHKSHSVRRWTRRKFVNQRLIASLGAVLLVTAISGIAYSHWTESLYISGTVITGHWIEKNQNLETIDDSFVRNWQPDKNWGTHEILEVEIKNEKIQYSFLKFDLSVLPEGSSINSAKLYLYGCSHAAPGALIRARFVSNDSWEEETITWNNMPAASDDLGSQEIMGANWYSWDVTGMTQTEYAGDNTLSLMLESLENTAYFYSKDRATNHPYLEITYV